MRDRTIAASASGVREVRGADVWGAAGSPARLGYMPALDGVRAVAMLGIMAFHGGFGWARGTFLSVDAFFVLSGFLITSLLVREWQRAATIDLRAFWGNRARRLLPALFLLLAGIALYALVIAPPDTRSALRLDALSTLFYVSNWHQILAGQSYFAQQALPSPLLHTWTLAIEEQFYLLWPLVVLGVLRWRRSLEALLVVVVALAGASVIDMALLFHPSGGNARVYYGTDTRAQSLLVGAALAIVVAIAAPIRTRWGRRFASLGALGGFAAIAWAWTGFSSNDPWLYRGGWALVALAVGGVLFGVVQVPDSLLARALSPRPLRYLGQISYGTYLWYWPVFLVVDGARTALRGYPLFALRVAITYAIAAVSFELLEMPVRRGALTRSRARLARYRIDPLWQPAFLVVAGLLVATAGNGSAAAADLSAAATPPVVDSGMPSVKVDVFGDSVAYTLAFGLRKVAPKYAIAIHSDAVVGCGLAVGGPVDDRGQVVEQYPGGVVGEHLDPGETCADWPAQWRGALGTRDPDVAVFLAGRWETLDRFHDGRWEHIGEPDFDAYLVSQLERAVTILHSRGAAVVLLSAPYDDSGEAPGGGPWPQEQPARMDRWNQLLGEVAARFPGVVTVIPLGAWLSTAGHYSAVVDGVSVRASDGIHLSKAGDLWLAPRLLPELAQIGRAKLGR